MKRTALLLAATLRPAAAFQPGAMGGGRAGVASSTRRPMALGASPSPFGGLLDAIAPSFPSTIGGNNASAKRDEAAVTSFLAAINARADPSELMQFFAEDITYVDTSYYNPIEGTEALARHFRLHAGSAALSTFGSDSSNNIVIDDIVATSEGEESRVCVMYHLATTGGEDIKDSTAISFYNVKNGKIERVFDVTEPSSPKPGDGGLKLLKAVSKLIGDDTIVVSGSEGATNDGSNSAVERYFEAWNRRDMECAASLFTDDCRMRDLQYDDAFKGREEFEKHLLRVSDCLPSSFSFVVDDIAVTSQKAGVLWHVENDGDPLAFTRGCSFYTIDERKQLISAGFEIPEKAPPKLGYWNTVSSKFAQNPVRLVPLAIWVAYMYILFISDGILPGANALQLEQRTWAEVRDLSLNFFLVAPALQLPFSPVVHPMLEGVFNLLLAWAAMFAGFLSDEREDKPNLLPFGPMLVGMQFLTSGFLLPYLFMRTEETSSKAYVEDITGDVQRLVAEWRPLGLLLGGVGSTSIFWGLFARPDFGAFSQRYASFIDLLSIDRVGSSFIVDLVIFAIFQSWFVDDDLQRRGIESSELETLRNVAKFVPFFGLAAYLTLRPPLPSREGPD
ncbi:hypothetical protein ACHAXT_001768 [Thalassiosira profunda]